jgi:mono/diheme cytochrome c family protein
MRFSIFDFRFSLPAAWGLLSGTAILVLTQGCRSESAAPQAASGAPAKTKATPEAQDDAAARAAFLAAYPVFMHPRCMNCHPSGDEPLQGDDSHPHAQNVKRGPDGKGLYALKCANCHQDANLPGENMPPGNPNWHLPPPTMRMVFQGKTPSELARQLKDPRLNGGRSLEQIVQHVSADKLVMAAWNPGDGRTLPPLSHDEFARKVREWADNGAAAPER